MTGCHGMVVVTTGSPHRVGSGLPSSSALSWACAVEQPAHPGGGDRVAVAVHPQKTRKVPSNA